MRDLPAPPVPADLDLRDFPFMPLDVLRLRDSDLATLATGDEFKAAVLLWCAAWHQVPAGSVPNDERWLARHSGAGAAWKRVREEALRGFEEHSDGRLYHNVVVEKALNSWQRKGEQKVRTLKARVASMAKRLEAATTDEERSHVQAMLTDLRNQLSLAINQPVARATPQPATRPATDPVTKPVTDPVTDPVTSTKGEGDRQGQGQGQGDSYSEANASGARRPPDFAAVLFGACRAWLQGATGKNDETCRKLLGRWRKSLPDGDLVEVLKNAQDQGHIEDPVPWIEAAIKARKGPPRRQHAADFN